MLDILKNIGIAFLYAIPAGLILYLLSRMQMQGWLDSVEQYFKSKTKKDEQEEEE